MAGLTTTQTFIDGDTVTAAKLNNIVSNCSIDADAVTTAKILNANVTLAKMATGSVDTGQLVADSVENSKLDDMAARTVKVNATDAAANPTDIAMSNGADVAENKLLVGTTDSINAVKFDTDLELDATDSAAADIRVSATLIGGKASVTADELDEILIKDATDGALKRATVQTAVQSQVATIGTSGVSRLATDAMTQNPMGSSGEADTEVQRINNVAKNPMLAKAVLELTTLLDGDGTGTGKTSIASIYNFGAELTSGTLSNTIRYYIVEFKSGDDFTNLGAASNATGIEFDSTGATPTTWTNGSRLVASPVFSVKGELDLVFSNNLDHARFTVMSTSNWSNNTTPSAADWEYDTIFKASSKAKTGFTINFRYPVGGVSVCTPLNIQILVF